MAMGQPGRYHDVLGLLNWSSWSGGNSRGIVLTEAGNNGTIDGIPAHMVPPQQSQSRIRSTATMRADGPGNVSRDECMLPPAYSEVVKPQDHPEFVELPPYSPIAVNVVGDAALPSPPPYMPPAPQQTSNDGASVLQTDISSSAQ